MWKICRDVEFCVIKRGKDSVLSSGHGSEGVNKTMLGDAYPTFIEAHMAVS